jgi:transcriptional regulator with XRE-family HTH domain
MYVGNVDDVAAVVRDRRRSIGWAQQRLADAMGVTRQWVISLESGSERAQMGMVIRAFRALDLGLDLFEDDSSAQLDAMLAGA